MSTTEELIAWAELVAIGRVAKSQGRRGEVAVNPLTDVPERFLGIGRVFMLDGDGEPVPKIVEAARMHHARPVVKLAGIDTIGQASALAGQEMRIPQSEVSPLPEGSYYHYDIIGLSVIDSRRGAVGTVDAVLSTGGADVLVVTGRSGDEVLIPLCAEICHRIDPDGGRIEVDLPEGLISLNEN